MKTDSTIRVGSYIIAFFAMLALGLFFTPHSAMADNVNVTNSVSAKASSGGNSSSGGSVVEGKTTSSVDIVSTVNGDVVTDVHEVSTDGEPINVNASYDNGSVEVSGAVHVESSNDVEQVANHEDGDSKENGVVHEGAIDVLAEASTTSSTSSITNDGGGIVAFFKKVITYVLSIFSV